MNNQEQESIGNTSISPVTQSQSQYWDINTYSLDLPGAKDIESAQGCIFCKANATHWTQAESGDFPMSDSYCHCEAHREEAVQKAAQGAVERAKRLAKMLS